jgi:anti-anti-sigma factor
MNQTNVSTDVRRVEEQVAIIDIRGEVTAYAEEALMEAYGEASSNGTRFIILNFQELTFMNSSGIGLLVTLLIRAQRQQQKLMAYGLTEHYQQIFELTRLNEAIAIYEDEAQAVAAAKVGVR